MRSPQSRRITDPKLLSFMHLLTFISSESEQTPNLVGP